MRTEDGSIIYECLNGKSEAFGIIVDKYKAGIYALVCAELGDFRDAEDVTQEIFIQAYRDLRSLRRWESFAFWLYRIAYTRCRKWIRSRSRRPDSAFIEDQDPEVLERPSLDAYRERQTRSWLNESLQEALDSLSETYREVLMLHYFGGMTIKDMARAIGVSPTAIGKRLSRARAQLKEEMVAMMDTAFEGQRLQANFTFRIVEMVKRIKIHPMPRMAELPWGLSLATGIIIAVLTLDSHVSILNPASIPMSSALPGEMRTLKTGDIPVDILKTAQVPALASMQGDGDDGKLAPLAAQGEADTWTTKAGMPTERWGMFTGMVDGKIYVIGGGKTPYGKYLSTVEEYDPVTDTWTRKADMPGERALGAASVVNGKIYVIGGASRAETATTTLEEYDPVTDAWTKKADMPTRRCFLSTSAVDGKIYAIGGRVYPEPSFNISTVEVYDPATDTWTKKADMPTAREFLSTSVVNGKIYAIGGVIGATGGPGISTVEEYDPATDTWATKTRMPTPRKCLSTCVVNGKIYTIGGGTGMATVFSTVEEYDPATDTWTRKAVMPTARALLSTIMLNGKVYAIGGDVTGFPWTPTAALEVYETGFVPGELTSVAPKGKVVRTWGEVKSD